MEAFGNKCPYTDEGLRFCNAGVALRSLHFSTSCCLRRAKKVGTDEGVDLTLLEDTGGRGTVIQSWA